MKRNIFGIAAIIIAISASAFTTPSRANHKGFTSYKWFNITGNISPTSAVPEADASYIVGGDGATPPDEGCSGSSYQCVSGFNATQVNSSNQLKGTQMPADVGPLQNL